MPELLDNMRGAYNDLGRDIDEWMDSVKNADLLLLDDLGAERANEWVRERIFVIVNHRYREELPTILTSNTGPKDLAAQLGERTASRIIAMRLDLPGGRGLPRSRSKAGPVREEFMITRQESNTSSTRAFSTKPIAWA